MLKRAAATTAALAGALLLAPAAHADDGGSGVGTPGCKGATMFVKVCAEETVSTPPSGGGSGKTRPANSTGGKKPTPPPCTYTKLSPQPPADNLAWDGHKPGDDGAVYQVNCPTTGRVGVTFVPTGAAGPAAPTVDPELVARRAVDSMKLVGPAVASPRAAGRYVVGMPMWMWVTSSTSSYGPATAKATAGGVTVTATAHVSTIRWDVGDGTTVTCTGPGTPYTADRGKSSSSDCGHCYERTSAGRPDDRYKGAAIATWAVEWTAPALNDGGTFTETRQTAFTAAVGEVQVLN
ncbi:ATP/GTP-binding protein [Streptomyces sp. NPDC057600]|uniref:ATP/GTP-binding protein n=1 Tax=Streptomyces sp. NPDC057600 TaxID=3346180 RepID=UPI0036C57EE5